MRWAAAGLADRSGSKDSFRGSSRGDEGPQKRRGGYDKAPAKPQQFINNVSASIHTKDLANKFVRGARGRKIEDLMRERDHFEALRRAGSLDREEADVITSERVHRNQA